MKKTIILPSIYTLIMGIGMIVTHQRMNISYGEKGFIPAFFPFLLILAIFACIAYHKYNEPIYPLPAKNKSFLLVFIPTILLALFSFVKTFSLSSSFLLTFLGAMLVGIGEEAMYRGVVFTRATKHGGVIKGILISALAFSLLHAVNVFGGLSFNSMIVQLINTFFMGIFFATSYYFTQNIIMIMIFHGLWDFIVLTPVATDYPFILILTVLVFALTIYMFVKISKQRPSI